LKKLPLRTYYRIFIIRKVSIFCSYYQIYDLFILKSNYFARSWNSGIMEGCPDHTNPYYHKYWFVTRWESPDRKYLVILFYLYIQINLQVIRLLGLNVFFVPPWSSFDFKIFILNGFIYSGPPFY